MYDGTWRSKPSSGYKLGFSIECLEVKETTLIACSRGGNCCHTKNRRHRNLVIPALCPWDLSQATLTGTKCLAKWRQLPKRAVAAREDARLRAPAIHQPTNLSRATATQIRGLRNDYDRFEDGLRALASRASYLNYLEKLHSGSRQCPRKSALRIQPV